MKSSNASVVKWFPASHFPLRSFPAQRLELHLFKLFHPFRHSRAVFPPTPADKHFPAFFIADRKLYVPSFGREKPSKAVRPLYYRHAVSEKRLLPGERVEVIRPRNPVKIEMIEAKPSRVLVYYGERRAGYPDFGPNAKPSGNASRKERFSGGEFSPEPKDVAGLEQLTYSAAKEQRTLLTRGRKRNSFMS